MCVLFLALFGGYYQCSCVTLGGWIITHTRDFCTYDHGWYKGTQCGECYSLWTEHTAFTLQCSSSNGHPSAESPLGKIRGFFSPTALCPRNIHAMASHRNYQEEDLYPRKKPSKSLKRKLLLKTTKNDLKKRGQFVGNT